MRREWMEPVIEVQEFVANEYVAACGDSGKVYKFECNAGDKIYILSILITFMLIQITMTSGMKAMKSWVAIMPVVLLTKHLYVTTF